MEWDQVKRVFNHQVKDHFPAGVVQRAELLRHGEDPAIEPGQLMVRVFIPVPEGAEDQGTALAEWEEAHRTRWLSCGARCRCGCPRPGCSSSPWTTAAPTRRGSRWRTMGRWPTSKCPAARS